MSKACLVYVTTPDDETPTNLARALLEKRLIACANILPQMQSIYEWQGQLQQDNEKVLIVKTQSDLVPKVTETIQALHPFECPCVVALPIVDGHKPFVDWIISQTGPT